MADSLITSNHVVAEWDGAATGWSARDWVPGPAGVVGLDLAGGLELDVDVADPSTFVGLWVPARRGRASRPATATLRVLLGAARSDEVLGITGDRGDGGGPGGGGGGRPVVLRTGADGDDVVAFRRRAGRGSGRSGVHDGLARLALAGAATADPALSMLARSLAHVDAAVAASALPGGAGFGGRARLDAAIGAELLLGITGQEDLDLDLVEVDELVAALERIEPLIGPDRRPALGALTDRLRRRIGDAVGATDDREGVVADLAPAAAYPMSSSPAAAARAAPAPKVGAQRRAGAARLLELDRRTLPHAFAADVVAVRVTTPSEVEVRIAGRGDDADGWWARGFGTDGVLVAAAPFRAVGTDAVARLLVPPEVVASVDVDITDRPGDPRPSTRALAVLDAVAAGQGAARAERIGALGAASARWRRSAGAWEAAGDVTRAGAADERARRPDRGRAGPELLADRAIEAAAG